MLGVQLTASLNNDVFELSWPEVWARRVARHYLDVPARPAQMANVVGVIGGIHAQVMASAELSVGLRVRGATSHSVREAIWPSRDLVRISSLRGTIHLLPAREAKTWLAALRARPDSGSGWTLESLGVRAEMMDRLVDSICNALQNGPLTRAQLDHALAQELGAWVHETRFPGFGGTMPVWRLAAGEAMVRGLICYGPGQSSNTTLALMPALTTEKPSLAGPAALAWVARRFLTAFGPATHRDFAAWLNTKASHAKEVFDSLGDEIEKVSVEGWKAWQLHGEQTIWSVLETVHLLPHFDTFIVACRPRERLVPWNLEHLFAKRMPSRLQSAARHHDVKSIPTLLVNGTVAGIWERKRSGARMALTIEPFGRLTTPQLDLLDQAANRVGEVFGSEVTWKFGRVDIRPHL
ncbi:MAG TPA: winged helix DNA-binding domain-containing protein [Chloroflexota bacterium]|jgi:hypothetical protein|nr:winged helix DNA-binding domain-containing protein [Chloroflexota bacterium]